MVGCAGYFNRYALNLKERKSFTEVLSAMLSTIWNTFVNFLAAYWNIGVGFLFSTVVAHYLVKPIVDSLWQQIGEQRVSGTSSTVQGYVERFLYTASYYVNHPSFIGFWPVLKVASQWKTWSEKPGYNIFLIGTGISIIYGVAGAKLIVWLGKRQWDKSILIPLILIISSLIFRFWIRRQPKEENKKA